MRHMKFQRSRVGYMQQDIQKLQLVIAVLLTVSRVLITMCMNVAVPCIFRTSITAKHTTSFGLLKRMHDAERTCTLYTFANSVKVDFEWIGSPCWIADNDCFVIKSAVIGKGFKGSEIRKYASKLGKGVLIFHIMI